MYVSVRCVEGGSITIGASSLTAAVYDCGKGCSAMMYTTTTTTTMVSVISLTPERVHVSSTPCLLVSVCMSVHMWVHLSNIVNLEVRKEVLVRWRVLRASPALCNVPNVADHCYPLLRGVVTRCPPPPTTTTTPPSLPPSPPPTTTTLPCERTELYDAV
ncbi:hypothetical protein Vafri_16075 [Volvox africanus]|uniref:Uncharacterized protein n=1 Tax=Volvox africanus TaxID=51714 RepID=A0A8J4BMH7_9CHLO|nr:hypothetical protein Vafri_16075 [Volvox africanus]